MRFYKYCFYLLLVFSVLINEYAYALNLESIEDIEEQIRFLHAVNNNRPDYMESRITKYAKLAALEGQTTTELKNERKIIEHRNWLYIDFSNPNYALNIFRAAKNVDDVNISITRGGFNESLLLGRTEAELSLGEFPLFYILRAGFTEFFEYYAIVTPVKIDGKLVYSIRLPKLGSSTEGSRFQFNDAVRARLFLSATALFLGTDQLFLDPITYKKAFYKESPIREMTDDSKQLIKVKWGDLRPDYLHSKRINRREPDLAKEKVDLLVLTDLVMREKEIVERDRIKALCDRLKISPSEVAAASPFFHSLHGEATITANEYEIMKKHFAPFSMYNLQDYLDVTELTSSVHRIFNETTDPEIKKEALEFAKYLKRSAKQLRIPDEQMAILDDIISNSILFCEKGTTAAVLQFRRRTR